MSSHEFLSVNGHKVMVVYEGQNCRTDFHMAVVIICDLLDISPKIRMFHFKFCSEFFPFC